MSEAHVHVTTVTIRNRRGLHARAAAKFVKLVETHDAHVTVQRGDTSVSGHSIMGLLMLAAAPGTLLTLSATGPAAAALLAALETLIADCFGEGG
jgi:phosphocarrier protein HPr